MPSTIIREHWPGFAGLKHIVIFGDSYSSVGYDSRSPHPNPDEPLGIEFPGVTWTASGDEPNWVGHLITNYSPNPKMLVYDYAVGGDTVSGLKHQVQYHFLRSLADKPDWGPWTAMDTLFVTWIGINDCASAAEHSGHMKIISELQQELYNVGARNFLFIGVPPMHRTPACLNSYGTLAARLEGWNSSLRQTVEAFADVHADATVMVFSSWNTFNRILDDPVSHGFQEVDAKKRGGGIWIDHIHPSTHVHDIIARDVSGYLSAQPAYSPPVAAPSTPSGEA